MLPDVLKKANGARHKGEASARLTLADLNIAEYPQFKTAAEKALEAGYSLGGLRKATTPKKPNPRYDDVPLDAFPLKDNGMIILKHSYGPNSTGSSPRDSSCTLQPQSPARPYVGRLKAAKCTWGLCRVAF